MVSGYKNYSIDLNSRKHLMAPRSVSSHKESLGLLVEGSLQDLVNEGQKAFSIKARRLATDFSPLEYFFDDEFALFG